MTSATVKPAQIRGNEMDWFAVFMLVIPPPDRYFTLKIPNSLSAAPCVTIGSRSDARIIS
jgi:hypothetical protein